MIYRNVNLKPFMLGLSESIREAMMSNDPNGLLADALETLKVLVDEVKGTK